MLPFCLYQYQGHEGAEEIYVACIDNKDLAEMILKNMSAGTEESELLEVNAITPLLVVKNNNDNLQLNNKKHTHDDWKVDSIPRVSSEERRTPTPLDVGDKHFLNSISDQKGYAEELFNSRNGHQCVEDGCGHCDVNIISYQDSGLDSEKDSDEIQTSLFIEIEESEEDRGTLEVLDEVLGEGEYGIVYKGRYGGRNGSITDVAVKKLKGMHKGLILLAYIFSHAVIVFSAVWADQQKKFDYTFFWDYWMLPNCNLNSLT